MPATPARIGFITQQYRLATAGPDATVVARHGDLARDVSPAEPVETFFAYVADAQALANERHALLKAERRRWQATLPGGAAYFAALDTSQVTPTARMIDPKGTADTSVALVGVRIDLQTSNVIADFWG